MSEQRHLIEAIDACRPATDDLQEDPRLAEAAHRVADDPSWAAVYHRSQQQAVGWTRGGPLHYDTTQCDVIHRLPPTVHLDQLTQTIRPVSQPQQALELLKHSGLIQMQIGQNHKGRRRTVIRMMALLLVGKCTATTTGLLLLLVSLCLVGLRFMLGKSVGNRPPSLEIGGERGLVFDLSISFGNGFRFCSLPFSPRFPRIGISRVEISLWYDATLLPTCIL